MLVDSAYFLIFAIAMIQDRIRKYIAENQLINKSDRLLLAVSGGGDSMAMLHFLHNEGYCCEIAHVNFQLRGEASDGDEALVRSVCKEKGLTLHVRTADTLLYAEENKISIEMAARDIRYDFFEELMKERDLDSVVVAHHSNDVVETFFINLMRGTGLRGLSGIVPRNGRVIRPFLSVSHQDLIDYLESRNLEYRTDLTNFDTAILRNELRQCVIPSFEEKKPGFSEIMQRTVGRLRQSEAVVNAFIQDWVNKNVTVSGEELHIPKEALYSSPSPSEILFQLLQPKGFAISIIDEIASQNSHRIGACYHSEDYRLIIDRDFLLLGKRAVDSDTFSIESIPCVIAQPLAMEFSLCPNDENFVLVRDKAIAMLDSEAITLPLTLRHWQLGDVFYPIGMGGKKKKVSDYFINQKFSIPQKEKTWLLCSGDDIVWIVGHRLDERYKVNPQTNNILQIKL